MRRQRGSILLYGLLALAVVTICGGALWKYNSTLEENAKLQSDLKASNKALDEQIQENIDQANRQKATELLLARRDGAKEERDKLERMIDAKLGTILSNSPEARAWWNGRVPADIMRSVRNDGAAGGAKDGARIPAGKPDQAKPGS